MASDIKQTSAISQIAAAFASANACNHEADYQGAGKFLATHSPPGAAFDSEDVAKAMFFVVGIQAMQGSLLGTASMSKAQFAKFCREQLDRFGPAGTVIPGALKP